MESEKVDHFWWNEKGDRIVWNEGAIAVGGVKRVISIGEMRGAISRWEGYANALCCQGPQYNRADAIDVSHE